MIGGLSSWLSIGAVSGKMQSAESNASWKVLGEILTQRRANLEVLKRDQNAKDLLKPWNTFFGLRRCRVALLDELTSARSLDYVSLHTSDGEKIYLAMWILNLLKFTWETMSLFEHRCGFFETEKMLLMFGHVAKNACSLYGKSSVSYFDQEHVC